MSQFSEEILEVIIDSGEPWITVNDICESVQCPPSAVEDCLMDLESARMVKAWESDEGLFITLTPLAADRLCVHLVNISENNYRWTPKDESAITTEKRKRLPKTDWRGVQRFDECSLPYPTILLGAGTALWDNVKHAICPGCGNRELEEYEFCLLCDRWGLDHLLLENGGRVKTKR